ncbi:DEAD/DEAH box helicase family protein [Desulfovibrio sulfodismutans]|uniref:DEAD/DEAH box helicase family protein n=1 Tax=Desulfolutivibrio sulfodismutans TaxID=63561 RepID=A0A7K3NNH9_9BACT|nr:helicase-related protein [Desulfolutivibrio sulfodismutans]NDY57383.1 DEAD/DEAH box helicase family protein [Desulfolutivibrio sulfodismutans]QLA12917.1 helicase [Desulfolutivibrio sulfodismutans DSM 3696]
METLKDIAWKAKYSPEDGDLLELFYIPALRLAKRYDRTTGFFGAEALALAARGMEGLVRNKGCMRLVVGCTLDQEEVEAIEKGQSLRDTIGARLLACPLEATSPPIYQAMELLAWMVANRHLDVKVAVPCDLNRRLVAGHAIFHEKTGVIEDEEGNRVAFSGSINETAFGWRQNWESFHVFNSWGGTAAHVDEEEKSFAQLWSNTSKRAVVIDVPQAVRQQLLTFAPKDGQLPMLLTIQEDSAHYGKTDMPEELTPAETTSPQPPTDTSTDPRRAVWSYIRHAPALPGGGELVGEATSAVTPWPHQVRAFERMYHNWPPKLLIADEVGLGKTIQAGLLLRQGWMAGRAKRILIMAPKAVLRQWQIELREKFNLSWPIYDGQKYYWYHWPGQQGAREERVSRKNWHKAPFVIVSSHLMRRQDRKIELLEEAEPWNLVVLDEAHHARRKGGGLNHNDFRPNQLLGLMQQLKDRTQGLILLTATPMQVSPVEVWDLLDLFGLPPKWTSQAFLEFFDLVGKPMPTHGDMVRMAGLFKAVEDAYGEMTEAAARKFTKGSGIRARRILKALRDTATIPLRQLETEDRKIAIQILRANTPVSRLISRHTRELLRKYQAKGLLGVPIATRQVEDRFVELTPPERQAYEAVENYISSTYNNAEAGRKNAVGFVMTIYRRRLASSFHALDHTLESRLARLEQTQPLQARLLALEEDIPEDGADDEAMDVEEASTLERDALVLEEKDEIRMLLDQIHRLGQDTKAGALRETIEALREAGYRQVMVFTQYTDTMDFLREALGKSFGQTVLCFSGRGGEQLSSTGSWMAISRDQTKKLFKEGKAEILLCTDAAAEGLNFQFCGALINYDMPWNPMRVEQRIGRIDRLGQENPVIRIVNLHYSDTVEADVYTALRERIGLFQKFVGRLQPILSRLPKTIQDLVLGEGGDRRRSTDQHLQDMAFELKQAEESGFDLDAAAQEDLEMPERPAPLYGLPDLGRILERGAMLPPGAEASAYGVKDFIYGQPGMDEKVRVTTDPGFYDQHSDSVELWSPGNPVFPEPEIFSDDGQVSGEIFARILR